MNDQKNTPNSAPAAPGHVTFDYDIVAAGKIVLPAGTRIYVRKRMGGALRGVNRGGLVRMDYHQ